MSAFGERSRSNWTRPAARLVQIQPEERRSDRTTRLGSGSLACPRCDAPVLIDPLPHAPGHPLSCPFCDHCAPLHEFLSLAQPARPARVVVRVTRGRA